MSDYVTSEQFREFLEEEKQHHQAADDRTRAVEVQVAAVGQQVAALGMHLGPMQDQLKQHHKTLYGNGEPGMDEQMRQMGGKIEQIVSMLNEQKVTADALANEKKEAKKWWQGEGAKYAFFLFTIVVNAIVVVFFGK
jgi:predicted  nucleic acid-binding Zn-ribbon protein